MKEQWTETAHCSLEFLWLKGCRNDPSLEPVFYILIPAITWITITWISIRIP